MEKQKFDAVKVAELAAEIARQEALVAQLRENAREAESVFRSAETRLCNMQIEFTRAVESKLDMTTLRVPQGHPV